MICYASAMGAGRNRYALKAAGWRLLINPLDPRDPAGFAYCLDNGAWGAFKSSKPWDEAAFEKALDRYGAGADFVVLPDIVAGGMESLALSLRWSNRCMASCNLVLIAVQDGMEPADLEPFVGPRVGIFLGGSTEWKLAQAEKWGRWCAARPCVHPLSTTEAPRTGIWFHFARVNTGIRFRLANAAGADSVDGSSATKFADTLPLLENARRQPDLFAPCRIPEFER